MSTSNCECVSDRPYVKCCKRIIMLFVAYVCRVIILSDNSRLHVSCRLVYRIDVADSSDSLLARREVGESDKRLSLDKISSMCYVIMDVVRHMFREMGKWEWLPRYGEVAVNWTCCRVMGTWRRWKEMRKTPSGSYVMLLFDQSSDSWLEVAFAAVQTPPSVE